MKKHAFIRMFPRRKEDPKNNKGKVSQADEGPDDDRILIIDTETTPDAFQNTTIGAFEIHQTERICGGGLFYHPCNNSPQEIKVIQRYCSKHNLYLYTLSEFLEKVFYVEVLDLKSDIVFFNAPFDLSRMTMHFGNTRHRTTTTGDKK
ncbi:MAG: hypothetical protein ABIC95_06010 [archaeon]